jgi:four helix bundle protein
MGHKNLAVWKRSMDFVVKVYRLTKTFPKEELYCLTSQMRRAAISIPSNLAEGHAKRTTREFIRFTNISYGSAAELETQIMIAEQLGYAPEHDISCLISELSEIEKMINGLLAGLEKKLSPSLNSEL